MNDGSTKGVVASVPGRKCRDCREYPDTGVDRCYCALRGKQVLARQTACVLGRKR